MFLELNTLSNLKEWPTIERYGEYVDYGLAIAECQSRLQGAATTRLFELGGSDVDLGAEPPHFYDSFPDIPNWVYHLAETEYQTAEEIWEQTVVSDVDLQTGQVSAPHQLQVLEGIFVIGLLLTSPRGLAAVFYFIDIWESHGSFIFPTFDYLCGFMNEENYVTEMKKRETYLSDDIGTIDPTACTREQLMSILRPYIPVFSEEAIRPYKVFAEEVKSLGEIEAIDISIC